MAIELSNLTFTEQDDIVPASGVDQIVNTGIANTFAGNDSITGTYVYDPNSGNDGSRSGIENFGSLDTGEGDDIINASGGQRALSTIGSPIRARVASIRGRVTTSLMPSGGENGILNNWAYYTEQGFIRWIRARVTT